MTVEGAYRVFFETYDNLEANRKQRRLLLKPKYLEAYDNDTKRTFEEKSKDLRWVVETSKNFAQKSSVIVTTHFEHTKTVKAAHSIESELSSLEKLKLKTGATPKNIHRVISWNG